MLLFIQPFSLLQVNLLIKPITMVLACYRSLYRTRKTVFEGDVHALQISAKKLRDEFRKNISVNDPKRIEELLEVGQNVESLLKKHVVQLRLNDKGNYGKKNALNI
ncbi:complex III assembly factor LYRM7-like isoform X2 [Centruroides sculpturatus]|uniref:complex III assembly factor LYRM7-like isoform X2 n=1 Tax=Centruroides sculpturatus TaxID=218467 RepID=UPI000C6D6925|nr:complex III assembly factor LYRM7-like isoform X2 [Centruroides sculpturatus]